MEHLPLFVKLSNQPCLVVGGGVVAERKAGLLRRAGARVTIAAPAVTPALERWYEDSHIYLELRPYDEAMLAGQRLVIAATDDERLNARVAAAAEKAGILCNVVDDNEKSGFILPAIVDRSPITIAIGTGGRAPVLARRLKARIEAWLPARIGELAEKAGRWRTIVRRRFPDATERRYFWQRFFDGPVADHILAGRLAQADRAMRRELIDGQPAPRAGEASIVGAGPGDPGLVTLRAQQLIGEADVVLYDRLVSSEVLDMARKEAELIAVGKSAGSRLMSQERINALLVEKVRAGHRVCRLKGGDPFVFGRGGEEAQALADAGLPFQIVPGISAALGCAAYAGIPLTLRGVSTSITLATARLDDARSPDWKALARPGQTLALYMSVGALGETARQLLAHGLAAETPVAMVENGTTGSQRVLHSRLSQVAADAEVHRISAPAMLFIGASVAHARGLQWFEPSAAGLPAAFPNPATAGPVARTA
jgi:uroporphyrin-III C-methyltransferase/precorrin-2 dehydrogenase/sirohydrochlorin ferrochelatase